MGHGEVPSLLVYKPFSIRDRSATFRSLSVQKPQPSNSKAAKDPIKNLSIPHHSVLHSMCHKSTCQLLVKIRRPEGYNLVMQTSLVSNHQPTKHKK